MADERVNIPDFSKVARELMEDAVSFVSVTGLNFFKDSFAKEGFTDTAFVPWPHRKDGDNTRAVLTNTGFLRDSTQVLERSPFQIAFGNTAVYADIHNNGGIVNIRVTPKSRKFFWFMYYSNVDKGGNVVSGGSPTAASMWKALALTKKAMVSVKIPKRQFIGESKTLMNDLNSWFVTEISNRFSGR